MSLVHNERTKLLATALNAGGNRGYRYRCSDRRLSVRNSNRCREQVLASDRAYLAFGRIGSTCSSSGRTRETEGMTDLQLYLLVAPFVLLAIGAAAGFWWTHRSDQEHHR